MQETVTTAEAYYTALGNKNIEEVCEYLHPDIQFADPQEKVVGKEAVLAAAKNFTKIFKALSIHAKFGSENQAVVIYDLEMPTWSSPLRAASLLSFQEGLISKIELIYNMQGFVEEK